MIGGGDNMSNAPRICALVAVGLTAGLAAQTAEPLVGRLVDPGGAPVGDVVVEAWRAGAQGTGSIDLADTRAFERIASWRTSKNGRILLRLPVGLPVQLRIDHPPYARVVRDAVIAGEGLRVQFERPAVFTGRVIRAGSSAGAPSKLRAWRRQEPSTELFAGRTAEDGSFRFDRLAPGTYRVSVVPDEAMRPSWLEIELVAGETTEKIVEVADGVLLRGRVVDAATGQPIAGAEIGEGWTFDKMVRTDADGRFAMRGYGASGYGEAYCRAEGYVKQVVLTRERKDDPLVLDFGLVPGQSASGKVVGPSGEPVAGVYVAVVGMAHDGTTHRHDWLSARTGPDGSFQVAGLHPDLQHVVQVRQLGLSTLVYNLPSAEKDVKKVDVVRLRPPRVLRGRLVGADSKPLPLVKVGLWGCNDDRQRLAEWVEGPRRGSWDLLKRYVAYRNVHTDANGCFAFGDLADGTYDLLVYNEQNQILGERRGVKVEAGRDPDPIEVSIDR
jgi:protocatechuate 3,4-dioxygenase beta subunit